MSDLHNCRIFGRLADLSAAPIQRICYRRTQWLGHLLRVHFLPLWLSASAIEDKFLLVKFTSPESFSFSSHSL